MTTDFARLIAQQERLYFHTTNFLRICLSTKGIGKGFLISSGAARFPETRTNVYPSVGNSSQEYPDILKAFQSSVELAEQIAQCFDKEGNPERGWRVEQSEELQQAVLTIRAHLAQFYAYLSDPAGFEESAVSNGEREQPEWRSRELSFPV